MKQIFYFLCGKFRRVNFIYAIKNDVEPWHYFEESDSRSSAHESLPPVLDSLIGTLDKVRTIQVPLSEDQWSNYYRNQKFVFKNKELKPCMNFYLIRRSIRHRLKFVYDSSADMSSIEAKSDNNETSNCKSSRKNTKDLVFMSGQSNPLLFLDSFEKCCDVKTEKDKMLKIRNFVDACHRGRILCLVLLLSVFLFLFYFLVEFSELYFTSDWPSVRQNFVKKYASIYTENKKKDICIDFTEESNLRSFFERKLNGLSSYSVIFQSNRNGSS